MISIVDAIKWIVDEMIFKETLTIQRSENIKNIWILIELFKI